ncbi:MAG TPA: tyrosine-type recombinase/integrase [Hyphomicrobiaceae bacterium]|nr:tyrosine-type recombinase/integrase [Hyphomicrobiaceae bacterium]
MAIRKRVWWNASGEQTAWVVDYKDQHGKRRLKTFKRKKEADAWWSGQAGYEVAQGIHTAASASPTVAEAADLWLDNSLAEGLERSTIDQRRRHIDLHINPLIGSVKLADLSAPRVNAFVDQLRDAGRSLAMRRKVLSTLKTLVTFAQGRGLVAQNAARSVRIKTSARDEGREMRPGTQMPTKAELRAMIDNAPPRWRAFIVTAIFTGMRASELRGLRWEDVDLDAGVLTVRQRADPWGDMGAPKSKAGRRDIPLAPMAINALREWRLACPKAKGGALDLAFPNGSGRVESHANIRNRVFGPLQVACGITGPDGKPKYGLHALRHAAASLFIEQGWTPKKVQTVIGHASIQMTFDLYGKLFVDTESDRKAMERLEAALLVG